MLHEELLCLLASCVNFVGVCADLVLILLMQGKELKGAGGQACHICGDTVGISTTSDVFVACNECALLVCRPCYEYEREDGVLQGVDGLLKRQRKAAGWQRHQEPKANLQDCVLPVIHR